MLKKSSDVDRFTCCLVYWKTREGEKEKENAENNGEWEEEKEKNKMKKNKDVDDKNERMTDIEILALD